MARTASIAMAMGLGYVLGRKRKLRAAVVMGMATAATRLAKKSAGQLNSHGGGGTPDGSGNLTQLLDAAKVAARSAFGRPATMLAERLDEAAGALRQSRPAQQDGNGQEQDGNSQEQNGNSQEQNGNGRK